MVESGFGSFVAESRFGSSVVESRNGSSGVESGLRSPISVSKGSMGFLPCPVDNPSMIHRMIRRFPMMILPWTNRLFQQLTRRRMIPGTPANDLEPVPTRTPSVP